MTKLKTLTSLRSLYLQNCTQRSIYPACVVHKDVRVLNQLLCADSAYGKLLQECATIRECIKIVWRKHLESTAIPSVYYLAMYSPHYIWMLPESMLKEPGSFFSSERLKRAAPYLPKDWLNVVRIAWYQIYAFGNFQNCMLQGHTMKTVLDIRTWLRSHWNSA